MANITGSIILNSNNVVPNTNNTQYSYKFPSPINLRDKVIALNSIQIYYSWFNINGTLYNNNIFSYTWFNASGVLESKRITIKDGNYSIESLNAYIQLEMKKAGHYVIRNSDNVELYFIRLIENPTYYSIQIDIDAMFNSLQATQLINNKAQYSVGGGGWAFPPNRVFPQVLFSTSSFIQDFLGFDLVNNSSTYYPASSLVTTNTSYSVLSTKTPITYPVSSIIIRCNLINNSLSNPVNDILYSFSQGSYSYGDLITESPNNLLYQPIGSGSYSNIILTFYDQNLKPMNIKDNQVLICLLIKDS